MMSLVLFEALERNSSGSKRKWFFFAQEVWDGGSAAIVDHARVDGKSWDRVEHLVAWLDEREDGEEHDRLGARRDHDHLWRDGDAARFANVIGDGLAQLGDAGAGGVLGLAISERACACFDDVLRRGKIGLAHLKMDDVLALGFERARFDQYLERRLGAETTHSLC